jgi:hypothetical protein
MEGMRLGLVPSLSGRVRVGLYYSKNETFYFTMLNPKT